MNQFQKLMNNKMKKFLNNIAPYMYGFTVRLEKPICFSFGMKKVSFFKK
jgi:hypothetical protein